jgi:hypothetical protein
VAVTWDPVLLPDGGRLAELVGPAFDALASETAAEAPADALVEE